MTRPSRPASLFLFCAAFLLLTAGPSFSEPNRFTLSSLISYAVKHNPALRIAGQNIEIENQGVRAAQAERLPRIDVSGGYTRYRYPAPLTPVVLQGFPMLATDLPEFERNVYDGFAMFSLPLFKGGRLMRNVRIAELKKSIAGNYHTRNLQELVYNVTAVYYKIAQLNKLLDAYEAQAKGLSAHRQDVENFLKAGTVPRLDLLKADVELAAATEKTIQVRNNMQNAKELMRSLIGMEGTDDLDIVIDDKPSRHSVDRTTDLERAFAARPDYKALSKKVKMLEERVAAAKGKRLPDVYASGDYGGKSGDSFAFKENWGVGVRFLLPVFDFGRIQSEIDKERCELINAREEERSLRLTIVREIKEAQNAIVNADERISVTGKAIASAIEQVRVEDLRYKTGDNTSTDVINAESALIRSRSDHYQARFDREIAVASLQKATGDTDIPANSAEGNNTPATLSAATGTIRTNYKREEKR